MTGITEKEKQVARLVQGDIPLDRRPFAVIADQLGMGEEEVISILKNLRETGIMRRFGAILQHRKAGFSENAMVVWEVPENRCEETGLLLASYGEISHCYERTPPLDGRYNLFTMVHLVGDASRGSDSMNEFICRISGEIGIGEYLILKSIKELKKSSMEYF